MKMLVDTLHAAGDNPYSWAIVGLIGTVAAANIYKYRTCPYLCRTKTITPEESAAAIVRPFAAGPRFILVMLAGIGAILAGLTMLSSEANPPLALLLIVLGVFAVQSEPALLRVQDAVDHVVAAQSQGAEAIAAAEERLRYAHVWMSVTTVSILVAVVLLLLAF
jgi:hypothetical protein